MLLPLCFDSSTDVVLPLRLGSPLTPSDLILFEATDWSQVAEIGKWTGGQVLAVEYPPQHESDWSRVWLLGKNWPPDQLPKNANYPVGVLSAEELVPLITNSLALIWHSDNVEQWGGANRWFEWNKGPGRWILFMFGTLFAISLVASAVFISLEKMIPLVRECWQVLYLAPASLLVAGFLCRIFGLPGWPIYYLASIPVVWLMGIGCQKWLANNRSNIHPWAGASCIGLLLSVIIPGEWSLFGTAFRPWTEGFASEHLGCILFYGALSVRQTIARDGVGWFASRVILTSAALWGPLTAASWNSGSSGVSVALIVVAWLIGDGFFKPINSAILALLPYPITRLLSSGQTLSHLGAIRNNGEAQAIDYFALFQYQSLPILPWCLIWLFGVLLFSGQFMIYHLAKIMRRSEISSTVGILCLAVASTTLLTPEMIGALAIVVAMSIVSLGYESVAQI